MCPPRGRYYSVALAWVVLVGEKSGLRPFARFLRTSPRLPIRRHALRRPILGCAQRSRMRPVGVRNGLTIQPHELEPLQQFLEPWFCMKAVEVRMNLQENHPGSAFVTGPL